MKPVIFGIKGTKLSQEEIDLFKEHKPAGFIIFTRNIESKQQLAVLVSSLKALFRRKDTLILIDQEGGRVQRLKEPHTKNYPAPKRFSDRIEKEGKGVIGDELFESNYEMASELAELGINVNCTPVADLYYPFANNVIGDRSFGSDIEIVESFCRIVVAAHRDAGVRAVVKHIPGHGRALKDSHLELPYVDASLKELEATDFAVFRELGTYSDYAMTAHVVYNCLDPENPVTLSKKAIEYIRKKICFKGKIITDCITMKALPGTYAEKTIKALEAGCDYVLHCSGDIDEMREIVSAL